MEQPTLSSTARMYLEDAIRGNRILMLWENEEGLHISIPPWHSETISSRDRKKWDDAKYTFLELSTRALIATEDNRTWRIKDNRPWFEIGPKLICRRSSPHETIGPCSVPVLAPSLGQSARGGFGSLGPLLREGQEMGILAVLCGLLASYLPEGRNGKPFEIGAVAVAVCNSLFNLWPIHTREGQEVCRYYGGAAFYLFAA